MKRNRQFAAFQFFSFSVILAGLAVFFGTLLYSEQFWLVSLCGGLLSGVVLGIAVQISNPSTSAIPKKEGYFKDGILLFLTFTALLITVLVFWLAPYGKDGYDSFISLCFSTQLSVFFMSAAWKMLKLP